MAFGQETTEQYVVGQIKGNLIVANFGNNDRILFLLMGAALTEIQSFEFLIAHVLALFSGLSVATESNGYDIENLAIIPLT